MTTMWRPFLGKLAELWCRCDICAFSAPATHFNTFMNDRGEQIQLCQRCRYDPDVLAAIQAGKRWRVLDA